MREGLMDDCGYHGCDECASWGSCTESAVSDFVNKLENLLADEEKRLESLSSASQEGDRELRIIASAYQDYFKRISELIREDIING